MFVTVTVQRTSSPPAGTGDAHATETVRSGERATVAVEGSETASTRRSVRAFVPVAVA